jgi:polyphosphate kinase
MTQNIDHRAEALVPIQGPKIVQHICDDILAVYFADTAKSQQMLASGAYVRRKPAKGKEPLNAQEWLLKNNRKGTGESRLQP